MAFTTVSSQQTQKGTLLLPLGSKWKLPLKSPSAGRPNASPPFPPRTRLWRKKGPSPLYLGRTEEEEEEEEEEWAVCRLSGFHQLGGKRKEATYHKRGGQMATKKGLPHCCCVRCHDVVNDFFLASWGTGAF